MAADTDGIPPRLLQAGSLPPARRPRGSRAVGWALFTLSEDFGYLPKVAFNLDALFRRAAHGKQARSSHNVSLCNGRWPTQILVATIFIGALAPAHRAGLVSAAAVAAPAGSSTGPSGCWRWGRW